MSFRNHPHVATPAVAQKPRSIASVLAGMHPANPLQSDQQLHPGNPPVVHIPPCLLLLLKWPARPRQLSAATVQSWPVGYTVCVMCWHTHPAQNACEVFPSNKASSNSLMMILMPWCTVDDLRTLSCTLLSAAAKSLVTGHLQLSGVPTHFTDSHSIAE
jgi:hypothetical protein